MYRKHFWKSVCKSLLSSAVAFLNMSVASKKSPSLQCWFQWTEGKSQLEPGQESVGDVAVLSHSSLLRNPRSKPNGVLEHFVQKKPPFCFQFFRGTFVWRHPWGDEGCQSTFLYSQ